MTAENSGDSVELCKCLLVYSACTGILYVCCLPDEASI